MAAPPDSSVETSSKKRVRTESVFGAVVLVGSESCEIELLGIPDESARLVNPLNKYESISNGKPVPVENVLELIGEFLLDAGGYKLRDGRRVSQIWRINVDDTDEVK